MRDMSCLGCEAMVPEGEGTHTYMLSATGCWERYCSLGAWKAGLAGEEAARSIAG